MRALAPYSADIAGYKPKRKSLELEQGNNAFIKSVKQDFVRNPRMMSGTKMMILMLVGWSGQEQAIETTRGIIGKKIGKSASQVSRYLKDAIEEGYLVYAYTKDRIGYITGIKIYLNFSSIRAIYKKKKKTASSRALPSMANTNSKNIYKRKNSAPEQAYMDKLEAILRRNNLQSG